jgi:hypothetical protein
LRLVKPNDISYPKLRLTKRKVLKSGKRYLEEYKIEAVKQIVDLSHDIADMAK